VKGRKRDIRGKNRLASTVGYPSPFRLSSCRKRLEGPVVVRLVDLAEEALRVSRRACKSRGNGANDLSEEALRNVQVTAKSRDNWLKTLEVASDGRRPHLLSIAKQTLEEQAPNGKCGLKTLLQHSFPSSVDNLTFRPGSVMTMDTAW